MGIRTARYRPDIGRLCLKDHLISPCRSHSGAIRLVTELTECTGIRIIAATSAIIAVAGGRSAIQARQRATLLGCIGRFFAQDHASNNTKDDDDQDQQ